MWILTFVDRIDIYKVCYITNSSDIVDGVCGHVYELRSAAFAMNYHCGKRCQIVCYVRQVY